MDHAKPTEGKDVRSHDDLAALRATEKDRTDESYIYFSETRGLLRASVRRGSVQRQPRTTE